MIVTSLIPQSGLSLVANTLKYYFSDKLSYSFLNLTTGQIQISRQGGLSEYQDLIPSVHTDIQKFIALPSNMLNGLKGILDSQKTYVVLPESVEDSLWRYLIVCQSRVGSISALAPKLSFAPNQFVATADDVRRFRSQLINNQELVVASNANIHLIKAPNSNLSIREQMLSVLTQANIADREDFIENKLSKLDVYVDPSYVQHPSEYFRNRNQIRRWAGDILNASIS